MRRPTSSSLVVWSSKRPVRLRSGAVLQQLFAVGRPPDLNVALLIINGGAAMAGGGAFVFGIAEGGKTPLRDLGGGTMPCRYSRPCGR